MSHESVWYSRPRNYGKGSREWYVIMKRYCLDGRLWNVLEDLG